MLWRYTTCTNINQASIIYILLMEELLSYSFWRRDRRWELFMYSLFFLQDPRSLAQDDEVIMLF